jgi:hypothetical protein
MASNQRLDGLGSNTSSYVLPRVLWVPLILHARSVVGHSLFRPDAVVAHDDHLCSAVRHAEISHCLRTPLQLS